MFYFLPSCRLAMMSHLSIVQWQLYRSIGAPGGPETVTAEAAMRAPAKIGRQLTGQRSRASLHIVDDGRSGVWRAVNDGGIGAFDLVITSGMLDPPSCLGWELREGILSGKANLICAPVISCAEV
ncbi:hypothetical protein [Rhizobium sp. WYCCWR 11146]|uniref:hypothetical protein n=1 Tax=Rhizobium sp. WYCCWR 11146 TaxID=2749833 RepID=UPI0015E66DFA|nr:hypothetical protein [Rhizobium sp. WYCCWR 11146]MBA1346949.1 hypothetical protein [Rhizobium sp. WYCCWR 11146]